MLVGSKERPERLEPHVETQPRCYEVQQGVSQTQQMDLALKAKVMSIKSSAEEAFRPMNNNQRRRIDQKVCELGWQR